jgi:hypothetical protein
MRTRLEDVGRSDGRHDSTEEVKLWRAQQNTRDFYKLITRPYNDPMTLKWIVTQTYAHATDLKKKLKKIDDYTSGRIPKEGYPGEVYRDPYEDDLFMTQLINDLLEQWNELSKEYDGASKVSMRDYMINENRWEYEIVNPNFFMEWSGEGHLCLVTGAKGSGKTDWSCLETEAVMPIEKKTQIFANIEFEYDIAEITYCSTFSKLVRNVCDAKLRGKESLIITDEAGLDFPSYEASTRGSKDFDKFMKLTRKFKASQIFITQYTTQIPWILRRNYNAWQHKYTKKTLRYELRTGKHAYKDVLIGKIPKSNLPFETEHWAGMDMDLGMSEMLEFISMLPRRANQFEELKNWIDRRVLKTKTELSSGEKKKIVFALLDYKKRMLKQKKGAKLTAGVIAEAAGVAESTARKWLRDRKEPAPSEDSEESE